MQNRNILTGGVRLLDPAVSVLWEEILIRRERLTLFTDFCLNKSGAHALFVNKLTFKGEYNFTLFYCAYMWRTLPHFLANISGDLTFLCYYGKKKFENIYKYPSLYYYLSIKILALGLFYKTA